MTRRKLLTGLFAAATTCAFLIPLATAQAAGPAWTQQATTGPAGAANDMMAYDSAHGVDVLFTTSGQTWTWNGSSWANVTPAFPAPSPPPRQAGAMAYDPAHQQVVLFGGGNAGNWLSDTWTWDGSSWTQQAPSLSPPARVGPAMAWDGSVGRLVMFGGFGGVFPGAFLADTWAWNGTTWTELIANFVTVAAGPAPRSGAQIAFDMTRNVIVMFGGTADAGALSDTWEWLDGAANAPGHWSEAAPLHSPPARSGGTLAYSSHAGAITLFGGASSSGGLLADTWTWDGGDWVAQSPTGQPDARSGGAGGTAPDGGTVLFGGRGTAGLLGDTWAWSGPRVVTTARLSLSCPYAPMVSSVDNSGSTLRSLAAAHHPGLMIGGALPADQILATDAETRDLAASQYNVVTSSNQMFWSGFQPQPNVYDFCDGDQFAGFAQQYGESLKVTSLIPAQLSGALPNWLIQGCNNCATGCTPVWNKSQLEQFMKDYITTVMTHYHGQVGVWGVISETIQSNGSPTCNVLQKVIGYPDYVIDAFADARAADPTATLLYDDYGNEQPGTKQDTEYSLIQTLKSQSLIDMVGFEMYGDFYPGPTQATLDATFSRFAGLGVKTAITQLAVSTPSVLDASLATASGDDLRNQAERYATALSACLDAASNCSLFMTWGVSDTYGLPNTAFNDALDSCHCYNYNATMLWDTTWNAKPAYTSVQTRLGQP